MPGRSINVVVQHSLSQEAAWDRVLSCLQSQKDTPTFVHVRPIETTVYHEQFKLVAKIGVTLFGHDETHTLTFSVDARQVSVTSDAPDDAPEAVEMFVEERKLKVMLTEAVK